MCQNCEYHSPKYLGRCPNCGAWSSFVEEVEAAEVKHARVSLTGEKTRPMKLAEITSIDVNRTKTEMDEFNLVLSRLSCGRNASVILTVNFTSTLRPICKISAQRLKRISQIF